MYISLIAINLIIITVLWIYWEKTYKQITDQTMASHTPKGVGQHQRTLIRYSSMIKIIIKYQIRKVLFK